MEVSKYFIYEFIGVPYQIIGDILSKTKNSILPVLICYYLLFFLKTDFTNSKPKVYANLSWFLIISYFYSKKK